MTEVENTLTKVDSLDLEHQDIKKGHRRRSSLAADVYAIEDLGEYILLTMARAKGMNERKTKLTGPKEKENVDIKISIETQKLGWYVNALLVSDTHLLYYRPSPR